MMKCNQAFRTDNPLRVLRSVYKEQRKRNSDPADQEDFIRLKSREIFNLAGLSLSETALYSILTKLAIAGHLEVHANPDHSQGIMYSITSQGIHCCLCHRYQQGFDPIPVDFKCGSIALDT